MACLSDYTLTGILADCNPNLAGISDVWIGYFDNVEVETSGNSVTSFAVENDGKLYHYSFAKQTGSLTSTITVDETNGTRFYTNEIGLQFTKMEAKKHMEMEALAAEHLSVIVKDNNGLYWLVGKDTYVSSTAQVAQSGTAFEDLNGYTLTLSNQEPHLPYEIKYDNFKTYIDGYKA